MAAGDQGVTAAASHQASGCLPQGTPARGPGALLSACLRNGQIALRPNGVSGGWLTPVARRQRGTSVAAGAGRRGIRVHGRAPARTLCRRGGGACAGERARPRGGVSGELAGEGGAARCRDSRCSVGSFSECPACSSLPTASRTSRGRYKLAESWPSSHWPDSADEA